jgi:hypothetical protein
MRIAMTVLLLVVGAAAPAVGQGPPAAPEDEMDGARRARRGRSGSTATFRFALIES